MKAIEVEELSKRYRIASGKETSYKTIRDSVSGLFSPREWRRSRREEMWALRDVSFQVEHGEVLGLIGRNGAGKSTLLKILSRITEPSHGVARVKGKVASLLEVGTGFHPELSGRENIFLNGAILGMKRSEILRKMDEIVSFAEIDRYIDTPVKRYSSGMYVRLAFAVAAHLESDILLVDEVLAVGDYAFQKKCLQTIKDAPKGGRTVIFVSHNLPTVERTCDKALLLRGGQIAESGPSAAVIRSYLRADQDAELHWQRSHPPTSKAWFESASLLDLESANRAPLCVTSQSHIAIDIACNVSAPIRDLRLALLVRDEAGTALFATSPVDAGVPSPSEAGRHRYRVEFPKAIFMPQRYGITLSLYDRAQGYETLENAISFDVIEVASLANLTGHRRMGSLQVSCSWARTDD
jgi:lipopolysaccharide transport system ATP-binding protein